MYKTIETPNSLQKLVCFFYCLEHFDNANAIQNLLPSNTEIMGWQYSGNWVVNFYDNKKNESFTLPNFYITGPQTVGYQIRAINGLAGILGAALQPGSLWQILNKPITQFKNKVYPTEVIFKEYNFSSFIKNYKLANNESTRLEIMIAFYENVLEKVKWKSNIIFDVIKHIFLQKGALNVAEILLKFNLNEKYLQRNFKEIVGTTPTEFIRNVRFSNVFTILSLSEEIQNKTMLARIFNYYDLSHFQKDYKYYFRSLPSAQMESCFNLFRELIDKDPYLLKSQKNS